MKQGFVICLHGDSFTDEKFFAIRKLGEDNYKEGTTKISGAAFTSGVTENLIIEYILTGNVTVSGPDVKNVITKSSNDKVKANNPPAMKLGFK